MEITEAQKHIFRCVMLKEIWTANDPKNAREFTAIVEREINQIIRNTGERLL